MVQNGKFSAATCWLHSKLKVDDLPTFGRPFQKSKVMRRRSMQNINHSHRSHVEKRNQLVDGRPGRSMLMAWRDMPVVLEPLDKCSQIALSLTCLRGTQRVQQVICVEKDRAFGPRADDRVLDFAKNEHFHLSAVQSLCKDAC
jgi:hypothetical protein